MKFNNKKGQIEDSMRMILIVIAVIVTLIAIGLLAVKIMGMDI